MSRGGSYGGGQSSLGYLFGSDQPPSPPPVSGEANKPPPSDDNNKATKTPPATPSPKQTSSNNYHRAQGQNTGNFITERPTTKVKSVPGGDSSLGYLFGEK
ncbi:protein SPIRAL1-like 5 [Magnolia sinica]|uniref:protein SPIRAL1-like 5 n=1 Tax=Magnolia sinica TaxID=86752 RepID=UPI002659DB5F|nr:protein SPIRAL1-like 5 [Magnolia sinica]